MENIEDAVKALSQKYLNSAQLVILIILKNKIHLKTWMPYLDQKTHINLKQKFIIVKNKKVVEIRLFYFILGFIFFICFCIIPI